MQIKSGIWFCSGFDVGISQKPFTVIAIGLKGCTLSKLVLGRVALDW